MHGPQTQTYGETSYFQGKKKTKYQTEPRSCMVLELKPMGKLATSKKKTKYKIEPRFCMVLGLKPMGKLVTFKKKKKKKN